MFIMFIISILGHKTDIKIIAITFSSGPTQRP